MQYFTIGSPIKSLKQIWLFFMQFHPRKQAVLYLSGVAGKSSDWRVNFWSIIRVSSLNVEWRHLYRWSIKAILDVFFILISILYFHQRGLMNYKLTSNEILTIYSNLFSGFSMPKCIWKKKYQSVMEKWHLSEVYYRINWLSLHLLFVSGLPHAHGSWWNRRCRGCIGQKQVEQVSFAAKDESVKSD